MSVRIYTFMIFLLWTGKCPAPSNWQTPPFAAIVDAGHFTFR
jgi:hypothetical protein